MPVLETPNAALKQIEKAGYLAYLREFELNGGTLRGVVHLSMLRRLNDDPRFANGVLSGLHQDVGDHREDFRSYNGAFGKGSLQIVIDRKTGRCYADVDKHNPYQDVVRFFGHAFGEVVPSFCRRLFRKK